MHKCKHQINLLQSFAKIICLIDVFSRLREVTLHFMKSAVAAHGPQGMNANNFTDFSISNSLKLPKNSKQT